MLVTAPDWKPILRIVEGWSARTDNAARNWGKGRSRAAARRRRARAREVHVRFAEDRA